MEDCKNMSESRLKKSYLNAKVNVFFYLVTLFISFFSRKIFLEKLGDDFVGLTGTLQNLLGFLNLAELGIGASIGYVLYKPLFNKDEQKINEIISVFGYLYRNVGLVILCGGIILSCFLPVIFEKTIFELGIIYFAFYSFLASSLIGYFINYRQTLLGADQKNYLVTAYFQSAGIVKILIQMLLAYYTGNYYLWVIIELVFGVIYSVILNWKINKVYPWLKSSAKEGKIQYPNNKIIIQKAKQMFVHVLAQAGRSQLLPFLVYAFASLKVVAYYGNYMIVITKLNLLLNNFLGSTGAGIGNLIAEGDKSKIERVFWELTSLRFWVAGVLTFSLYYLIDPFIVNWLGGEYVLGQSVLIIILCNFFISQFRGTNDQFIHGYGLFHDTWAPIATLIITVVVALVGGSLWGLPGVLLGDMASSITIISIWKPYLLYKEGFQRSVRIYWKYILRDMLLFILSWTIVSLWLNQVPLFNPATSYVKWIAYAIYSTTIFVAVFTPLMYFFSPGIKDLLKRFRR